MKRAAMALLISSVAAIALAYTAAIVSGAMREWSVWVMAVATPAAMVATIAVGAARADRPYGGIRRLIPPFAGVLLIMLGAFAAALLLPAAGEPLILGLPRRAALVLYGIGLLPALILPVAYALTFDELTLTEDDMERVREAAAINSRDAK